ncbi:MAG TPA: hypothetical protein VKV57_16850 [bacterium]|nr:hypothetical protein [bacterium]
MRRLAHQQAGAALILVVLGIFILVAVGGFIILAVDRNTELRSAFQKNVAGFNAAEAGIHVGAVTVLNAMQNFALPTNCTTTGTSFPLNGRTVTYKLSVPTGAPYNGSAGSCTEVPLRTTEQANTPFAGLNAQVYKYNLVSFSTNALGFTEASINNQFDSHLIPMFQFAAFYAGDLEYLPGPTLIVNGRLHANGNIYLNSDDCGASINDGMNVLGQITTAGTVFRGRKDTSSLSWNNVYISKDGTSGNMAVFGTDSPGSTSCAQVNVRQIATGDLNLINSPGQARVTTGIENITLPTPKNTLCVPWITGCSSTQGTYWQNSNFRLVLDTTTTQALNGSACPGSTTAPCLYPVRVLNVDGSVNGVATTALTTFMKAEPGAITYTDVPTGSWNCSTDATCETDAYNKSSSYTQAFPKNGTLGCTVNRGPRAQIKPIPVGVAGSNYCYDYRYGGFFNWREDKPILMMNVDWMALEEWNRNNGTPFFNPNVTTNNGLVVFMSVKDTTGTEGFKADNYGVRIYDAARARRGSTDPGVTFASDQAAYVTGNFNCPQPPSNPVDTSPASCGDAVWPPTGSTSLQKPTSIVADTANVLSCNWIASPNAVGSGTACTGPSGNGYQMDTDQWGPVCGTGCRLQDELSTSQSGTVDGVSCGGNGCAATQTIVNAAFLANNDQTWCSGTPSGLNCGESNYSGGLENYPRFHEDWSGVKFWYQGSFVAIGLPDHTCFEDATQLIAVANDPTYPCSGFPQGFWTNQRYSPPTRRWFYDVSFNNANLLPPLTPRFVYLNLVYFSEVFQ